MTAHATTLTPDTIPVSRRRDVVLLAALAVAATATALWALATVGLDVRIAAIVPHLLIGAIGGVLVLRTEARRLGWLMASSSLFVGQFTASALYETTGATWAGACEALGGLFLLPLLAALMLYPTGRPASRLITALVAVATAGTLLGTVHWLGVNLGWWEAVTDPLQLAITLSTLPLFLSFFEQARIYRRRSPVERQQVKWYVLGLFTVPAYIVPGVLGWSEETFALIDATTTLLFPLAVLLGITRYRLYEIDRLISRTVSYALVVALLAATFVGGVAGLTTLLPAQDDLAVAVTTVAVVGLFTPLLRRVRDVVDRRFDRTRYQAQQVVEQFGRTIRAETDLDAVTHRIHDVLGATLAPTTVAVWQPPTGARS
jgi:hypothetical protein